MEKMTARLELKMKEETFAGLGEIYAKHRISPAEVCRALAEAAVEYYRKNGRFSFPIILSEEPVKPASPVKIEAQPAVAKKSTRVERMDKHRAGDVGDGQYSALGQDLYLVPRTGPRAKRQATPAQKGRKTNVGQVKQM